MFSAKNSRRYDCLVSSPAREGAKFTVGVGAGGRKRDGGVGAGRNWRVESGHESVGNQSQGQGYVGGRLRKHGKTGS